MDSYEHEERRGRKKNTTKNIDERLSQLYYKEGNQFGIIKFYKLAQARGLPYSRKAVMDWLRRQKTYQLTRPAKKRRAIQPVIAREPFKVMQVDLTDYGSVKLLTMIDVFSKYAFVKRIPNKSASIVRDAIVDVFDSVDKLYKHEKRRLLSDNGPEFKNELLTAALDEIDVRQMFGRAYTPQSQGVVERFNGTFKRMLKRAKLTQQFVTPSHAFIQKLVHNYNHSYHSSIKMTPAEAIHDAVGVRHEQSRRKGYNDRRDKDDLVAGDTVRIQWQHLKDKRNAFAKSNVVWSRELYTVQSVRHPRDSRHSIQYRVSDNKGRTLPGMFTRRDLQKIYS